MGSRFRCGPRQGRRSGIVGSKVRRLEFLDLADEDDLTMVYETPEEVVEAEPRAIYRRHVACRPAAQGAVPLPSQVTVYMTPRRMVWSVAIKTGPYGDEC
jgi:hypothetical protein